MKTGGLPRLEYIAERLGVPQEEVSDQLDILDDMGAIKANRLMGGSAAPVIQTHGRAIVAALSPMSQELQQAILRALRERDWGRLASPSRPELAAELGMDEATVDDQLYALEDQQAITATRTFGGGVHPRITGRGKVLLEELSAAESHQRHSSPAISTPRPAFEWDIFICHASEDKEPFVRDLAKALAKHYRVWYDEFSLTVGDSLRRAIDRGLARSKYGVVVLSPRFFNKEWPQKELDGLVTLESDRKVILPVWLDIDRAGVRSFSPLLADRLAVHAERGMDAVVDEIRRAIESGADSRSLVLPERQAQTTDDRSLAVRIYEHRFAGGANFPCIMLTVAVENLADRNAFVDEVEVIAEAPFQGQAVEYQFREARAEGKNKRPAYKHPGERD